MLRIMETLVEKFGLLVFGLCLSLLCFMLLANLWPPLVLDLHWVRQMGGISVAETLFSLVVFCAGSVEDLRRKGKEQEEPR